MEVHLQGLPGLLDPQGVGQEEEGAYQEQGHRGALPSSKSLMLIELTDEL